MNSSTYKSVLRLLQTWPLDTSKAGRDFGDFIRVQVANNFGIAHANAHQVNDTVWEEISSRLGRLSSDHYKKTFGVSRLATSTGLSQEECHQAISNEGLQLLQEEFESKSVVQRVKESVGLGQKD